MAHYILVHGGLHGGWCWERMVESLGALGHRVDAPDLPGMGADKTPFADDTFGQWIEAMIGLLRSAPEPAILAGHSQGGPVISQAAELVPDKVAKLVFVTAVVRSDGETVQGVRRGEDGSRLPPDLPLDENGLVMFPRDIARKVFYGMCNDADVAAALNRLTPQPLNVLAARLSLSEGRFGAIPKYYIEARHDMALPLAQQREMQEKWSFERVATLESDHSPFYSAPEELTEALASLAN